MSMGAKTCRLGLVALVLMGAVASGCSRQTASTDRATNSTPNARSAGKAPVTMPTTTPSETTLVVFAGAAGKPALEKLMPSYETETGVNVDVAYGGSGALLTQFSLEQYGDVYIPGSDDFMDKAESQGAVLAETRTILAYLVPAICVAKGNPKQIHGLEDLSSKDVRLVLAQPEAVCLGDISEEILSAVGLLESVKANVASYAGSCEATLNNLILGEADAIIGWDVFARQQPDSVETIDLSRAIARPRNIPGAVIKWSEQPDDAQALIDFLASEEGREGFRETGYTVE